MKTRNQTKRESEQTNLISNKMNQISFNKFYDEYHGHRYDDLNEILPSLKTGNRNCIYLAGDSSLDNKFWFNGTKDAVNGYQNLLIPPISKQDIAYWLNYELSSRNLGEKYFSLNCAVEESSIGSRACCRLLEQDNIIRDNINENDILVVSIGGNDIALRPSICTVISMLSLICCTTNSCLDSCANGCALPIDDCCCGFGTGSSIIILKIKCKKFFLPIFFSKCRLFFKLFGLSSRLWILSSFIWNENTIIP